MIGLPSTSGGANISTGQGQGAAQVLDTSSFDPIAFMTNLNKERERKELERQKKQLDLNAKWAKIGTPDVKYVTDYNTKELDEKVTQYGKFITEAMTKGVDPDTDVELQRELQRQQMGILEVEKASKVIDGALAMYQKEAKNYPPEQYQAWLEGLNQQPTVKDRLNYVQSSQPFEQLIDPVKMLSEIVKPEVLKDEIEKYLGNGVLQTDTTYDMDRLKKILETSLYDNPAKQPLIEAYYRQKGFNSPEEMEADLLEVAKTLIPKDDTDRTAPWKPNSGGSGNSNATPNTEITPAGITTDPKFIPNEDTPDPVTGKTNKGLASLMKSEDPDDLVKISETDLSNANKDVNGIFVVNVKDNTQTREGNFIDVYGKPVTGKVNGFKFSQDGSLWVYVSDKLLPLVPSRDLKSQAAKDKGNANAQQVAKSLGREWSEIKTEIYNRKEGKSGGATQGSGNASRFNKTK